ISGEHLFRNEAGITEAAAAIALRVCSGEAERRLDGLVVHHLLGGSIEIVVVFKRLSIWRTGAEAAVQLLKARVHRLESAVRSIGIVGVGGVGETCCRRSYLEWRILRRQVAAAYARTGIQRQERREELARFVLLDRHDAPDVWRDI